ncbi:MAG: hypothetical protein K2Q06_05505, partial [Parvularculaceae bacterium]|nr:hypothetical protein [Parvularculaceae bacterium]
MKIALLNVKYSPNLGDGVIAECLEKALGEAMPGADVESVDLAGRVDFAPRQSLLRRAAIATLDALPWPLSDAAARYAVAATLRRTLLPLYAERLAAADALVIGGGQLIADAHLNFPTKIKAALDAAPKALVALHAVGVDRGFSPEGSRLFASAFGRRTIAALG